MSEEEKEQELAQLHIVRKIAGLCVACMEKHGGLPRPDFTNFNTTGDSNV